MAAADVVRVLLDCGANINSLGNYGNALQAASSKGHRKIVDLLLIKGIDVTSWEAKRALQSVSSIYSNRGSGSTTDKAVSDAPQLAPVDSNTSREGYRVSQPVLPRGYGDRLQLISSGRASNSNLVIARTDHGSPTRYSYIQPIARNEYPLPPHQQVDKPKTQLRLEYGPRSM
jgi:hypothetical protein